MSSHFLLEDRQMLGDNSVAVPMALALLPTFLTPGGDSRQIIPEARLSLLSGNDGELTFSPDASPSPVPTVVARSTGDIPHTLDDHSFAGFGGATTQSADDSLGGLARTFANPLGEVYWHNFGQAMAVPQPPPASGVPPPMAGAATGPVTPPPSGVPVSDHAGGTKGAGSSGQAPQNGALAGGLPPAAPKPSANLPRSVSAASRPGAAPTSPSHQASPLLGPNIVATFGINGPSSIPINADDDNGSDILKGKKGDLTGIPSKRDFDVSPINTINNGIKGDPDLMLETIVIGGYPTNGTFSISLSPADNNSGNVNFWWEATKTTALPASWSYDPNRLSFYIEGIKVSQAANDLTLILSYTYTDSFNQQQTTQTNDQLTVTPVVTSFSLTATTDQNVFLANGKDVTLGLTTYNTNGANPVVPIQFDADLIVGASLNGHAGFVQDLTGIRHSPNGTSILVNNVKTPVDWLYDGQNKGENVALKVTTPPHTFSELDALAGQITYVTKDHIDQVTNGVEWVYDDDAPTKSPADTPGTKDTIDVEWIYTTWVVYTWNQPVGLVLYALKSSTWSVEWYATGGTVRTLDGVTASGVYVVSNANPDCTDPYNMATGSLTWVPVP